MADYPLAGVDDVSIVWDGYNSSQDARIEGLIDKASALLRQAMPDVDDRINLHMTDPANRRALNPDVVSIVVATVVKRFLDNPTGALSSSVTTGPYTEAVGYGERIGGTYVQRGTLVVTEADLAQLAAQAATTLPSSIRVIPGWYAHDYAENGFGQ